MDTQSRQVPARSPPRGKERQVYRTKNGQKSDFNRDAVGEVEKLITAIIGINSLINCRFD